MDSLDPTSNMSHHLKTRENEPKHPELKRDDTFYADVIPVVFKVGDTLFRVRRDKFLQPGSFFETMFSLPPPEATSGPRSAEGQSDKNPIVLQGIEPESFRSLLRVMYPGFVEGIVPCHTFD
ncbi:hypothetical protein BJ165DRAFT_1526989 [Panaeolus papilionaceus]|nr:hypothetical protein BJ165DRAFT_1526989 [Panaeolus papilionaceus]